MSSIASQIVLATNDQKAAAAVIEREFLAAGYSPMLVAAALINAYAESRLDPAAVGDHGASIGLFQLNTLHGAGIGHSVSELKDPTGNAQVLLSVEKRALAKVQSAIDAGADLSEAAGLFSKYVERPDDTMGEMAKRAASSWILFPAGVSTRSSFWPWSANENQTQTQTQAQNASSSGAGTSNTMLYVLGGSSILLLLGTLYYVRKKRENETNDEPTLDAGAFKRLTG